MCIRDRLYSIPGRCGIEISVETVGRLAKDCPHIICVKEAGGSVERVNQLMQEFGENPFIGYWHDFGHIQRKHNLLIFCLLYTSRCVEETGI